LHSVSGPAQDLRTSGVARSRDRRVAEVMYRELDPAFLTYE